MAKEIVYSDIDATFFAHPIRKDIVRKVNRDAVKQSVKSLVLTNFYERPFKPDIGCNIKGLLFELFTPSTRQQVRRAIEETISNYEPRAEIIDILVQDYQDSHALSVTIAFFVLNDPEPVTLDILLERVR
jgi:phage baseplate assembly protein W